MMKLTKEMMEKVVENFERRTSSHPWWKSRKMLPGNFSIARGGVIHHNTFSEIEEFLAEYGEKKPSVTIEGALSYRYIKEWRVQIFISEEKVLEVPFSYCKQDSVDGNDEWEGLEITDFLAFKKIKPKEIETIQVIIRR